TARRGCIASTNGNTAGSPRLASILNSDGAPMKALLCDKLGSADFLEIGEIEKPVPKENEVLVKVHAVSINDWDWGMLLDNFPNRLAKRLGRQKRIIGSDVAGTVESVG